MPGERRRGEQETARYQRQDIEGEFFYDDDVDQSISEDEPQPDDSANNTRKPISKERGGCYIDCNRVCTYCIRYTVG